MDSFALISKHFLGLTEPPDLVLPFTFGPMLLDNGTERGMHFFPGEVAGRSSPNRNASAFVNLGVIAGGSFSLSFSSASFSLSLRSTGIRPVLTNNMRVLCSARGEALAVRSRRSNAALVTWWNIGGHVCLGQRTNAEPDFTRGGSRLGEAAWRAGESRPTPTQGARGGRVCVSGGEGGVSRDQAGMPRACQS